MKIFKNIVKYCISSAIAIYNLYFLFGNILILTLKHQLPLSSKWLLMGLMIPLNIVSIVLSMQLLIPKTRLKALKWIQALMFIQVPIISTPIISYIVQSVGRIAGVISTGHFLEINLGFFGNLAPECGFGLLHILKSPYEWNIALGVNIIPLLLLIYFAQCSKKEKQKALPKKKNTKKRIST